MNVLFISKYGDSLSLAKRVRDEGHREFFYILDQKASSVGEGIVRRVGREVRVANERGEPSPRNILRLLRDCSPELVVFDMVGLGKVASHIREMGYPVFGAGLWADNAELDRAYGYKLMKAAGIKTPPTYVFGKGEYEKAIEFVKREGKRFVYKPSGNLPVGHTYVARGVDDMVEMLRLWKSEAEFELQEYIDGVEVSCELWWNGFSSFLHNITMEEKRFMEGNIGPNIGCAGNVVKAVSKKHRIVSEGVGRMERLLRKTSYRGPLDLNSIVNEDGLFGLEFTARFGYDAVQALLELYRGSLTGLLFSIATGSSPEEELTGDCSIAVRLSIPPYPHSDDAVKGIPILGVEDEKHIWFGDAMKREGKYVSAGADGCVCSVTARGENVRECRRRAYRTVSNLIIPQVQYRRDIGTRFTEDFALLRKLQYL